jgi:hypothetical protein
MIHHIRREPERALLHARRAEAVAAEHRLATPISPIVLQAGALAAQGEAVEALAQLRTGKQRYVMAWHFKQYALALLSMTQEQVGDHAAALEIIAAALAASEESGARWWDAEIHRLKGMVLLARHDAEGAKHASCIQKKSRNDKMRDPSSCARPLASPAFGATRANTPKPTIFSPRSMAGSQRALIRWT